MDTIHISGNTVDQAIRIGTIYRTRHPQSTRMYGNLESGYSGIKGLPVIANGRIGALQDRHLSLIAQMFQQVHAAQKEIVPFSPMRSVLILGVCTTATIVIAQQYRVGHSLVRAARKMTHAANSLNQRALILVVIMKAIIPLAMPTPVMRNRPRVPAAF